MQKGRIGRRPLAPPRTPVAAPAGAAAMTAPRVVLPELPEDRPRARGAGWRTVAAKEFADHLLSARFIVLMAILGLATVASIYAAAGGLRDAASELQGEPALFVRLFTLAPPSPGANLPGIPPFFAFVGFLGPLLGIAFGFDAVNGERSEGTLPRLLAQPIHRDDVINGKFAAGLSVIGLILVGITLLVSGIALFRLGIVPSPEEILRIIVWLLVALVYVGFWLAFATLCSVVLRRAATSALVAISAWLVATLFAGLIVGLVANFLAPATDDFGNRQAQYLLSHLVPGTYYEEATSILLDPTQRFVGFFLTEEQVDRAIFSTLSLDQSLLLIWPQIVGLIALTAICFAAAYISFMRQEVRA